MSKKMQGGEDIAPDEIFLDSSNLPQFDTHQLEGRIERPLSKTAVLLLGLFFTVAIFLFFSRTAYLEVLQGEALRRISENNSLRHTLIFSERGIVTDRTGRELAWNVSPGKGDLSARVYRVGDGLAHTVGYVSAPAKDAAGFYYQEYFSGKDGVEKFYNETLSGAHGLKIVETDVFGTIISESTANEPRSGENLRLTIDARVEGELFRRIKGLAESVGFRGGAGVVMDVKDGSILALASFPEYDSNILTEGVNARKIQEFVGSSGKPFLNRAVGGLYIPGSIMKPFVALGALNEGIISPEEKILSTGSIAIPNPYAPGEVSVFRDWKAHGWVAMRDALAVSSDVYFYEVGGGYEAQRGLGISNMEKYFRLFGFGTETGIDLPGEEAGTIPTPSWKEETFNDAWRLGDTYNTAIGQYGFEVTPIQAVRAVSAIASDGTLVVPHVVRSEETAESGAVNILIPREYFDVVREGMREAVLRGTAQGLYTPAVSVAAKTGTAELGISKRRVNSWVIGFFPYKEPRFAFALVMESGPRENLVGATFVMREMIQWMAENTPEYLTP
ncbi:MAG: penicillin-binding transpeptidase domain-containing protein [Patescibacteria group bacterium]